jgi:DNA-directed RNA polymerase I, II, and III subunit RPABC2
MDAEDYVSGSDVESDIEEGEIENGKVSIPRNRSIEEDIDNENVDEDDLPNDEEEEYDDENYLQKFQENIQDNIIEEYHPELKSHNYEEINNLVKITRNENGEIVDPLHQTVPFMTKYEKARVIGERSKQINAGAKPLIPVEPNMIDGYLIALKEFEEKKTPFIIKRPLPNGGCEYWKLSDLEVLV